MSLVLRKSSTSDAARQYAAAVRTEILLEELLQELKFQTLGLELLTKQELSKENIRR